MEIDMSTLYLVDKDFKPADLDCNPLTITLQHFITYLKIIYKQKLKHIKFQLKKHWIGFSRKKKIDSLNYLTN
jgi:hypothetical protein